VRRWLASPDGNVNDLGPVSLMFAGGMAGIMNWVIALPIDTVKSRLQTAPDGVYSGFLDCLR
jgi:solute carrier family 25 carnitine/acylcarnitine transporter 20/29